MFTFETMVISQITNRCWIIVIPLILFSCQKNNSIKRNVQTSWTDSFEIKFEKIPSTQSQVDFNNQLYDQGNLNPFVWNFIYTGGGIAIGDLNNDGLPDLYFTGNQSSDKLYRNLGDFKFEDVSIRAEIVNDTWSTGVTMADVNADGLLDIYVCKTSPTLNPAANRNLLFINLGDFRFEEKAEAFGLDDIGYSIQSTFFDYDQDGDLDMYLVNQPMDEFSKLLYTSDQLSQYPVKDRLMLNENGKFKEDLRFAADKERYGLGVSIADFDQNGWTDIFIASDYYHSDQMLMNTNSRFQDDMSTRLAHTSFYSMGTDVGDINNDGWQDLFVLDMAFADHFRSKTNMGSMDSERFAEIVTQGHHYQYPQNTLQLNRGDGTFIDIAQLAGVAKTDWSWAGLFADLDYDGFQDIIVTNGILRDMQNNDFAQFASQTYGGQIGPENYKQALSKLPSTRASNHIFKNTGDLRFIDVSTISGFGEDGFSHGLAIADLDLDGNLDIVINEMNQPASIYRNASASTGNYVHVELIGPAQNTYGLGCQITAYWNDQKQTNTMQTTRGYYSSSEPVVTFGIGKSTGVDSIVVIWNQNEQTVIKDVKPAQLIAIDYQKSDRKTRSQFTQDPFFQSMGALRVPHHETPYDDYNKQILLPHKLSDLGPFVASGDINGDRRLDLFCGGAAGEPGQIYVQSRGGEFRPSVQKALEADARYEDGQSVMFDFDQDGDLDLYVVSGSNEFEEGSELLEDRLYENNGRGIFFRTSGALPSGIHINGQAVVAFDLGGDGDLDLLVGGRQVSGQYPITPKTILLENDNGKFADVTESKMVWPEPPGLVTDIEVFDQNGDGLDDLIIIGEWMAPIVAQQNNGHLERYILQSVGSGFWWSIEKLDIDNDGDQDFLLGNLGLNNKFSSRRDKSLEVRAGDLDKNGDHDIVLSVVKGNQNLPVRGRECSTDEMPFISEKFESYAAFGKAEVNDLFTEEQLKGATIKRIDTFHHVLLVNQGDLSFSHVSLPIECQTGPIKDFEAIDINQDGLIDFAFVGNHFSTEVETARYDATFQGYCLNQGDGKFKFHPFTHLPLRDYRSIEVVQNLNQQSWIFTCNNESHLFGRRQASEQPMN